MTTFVIVVVALSFVLSFHLRAQTDDLKPVPPKLVPDLGTFYSLQNPGQPPFPYDPFPELPVFPGVVEYDNTSWGDYSATTLDPTDDWSFWTVQEYANPWTGSQGFTFGRWGTVVSRIRPNP